MKLLTFVAAEMSTQSLRFVDPFNNYSPQIIDATLNNEGEAGKIFGCCFSPSGTWLASTSFDLVQKLILLFVWDLDTCGIAKRAEFPYFGRPKIHSMLWQENLVFCVTEDGLILEWQVQSANIAEWQLEMAQDEALVAIGYSIDQLIAVFSSGRIHDVRSATNLTSVNTPVSSAAFDQENIWLGTPFGTLFLVRGTTISNRFDGLLPGPKSTVTQISVHPRHRNLLLLQLKDRTIRLVDIEGSGRPMYKLLDVVNRWNWSNCGFSADGEIVWATVRDRGQHLAYLWETNGGSLSKMLEGPRTDIVSGLWSPRRPMLLTVAGNGIIFRWIPDYPIKWSALVPGLEEAEQNVEYIEREDEFDITIEEELLRRKKVKELEELQHVDVFNSSDLDPKDLADIRIFSRPVDRSLS